MIFFKGLESEETSHWIGHHGRPKQFGNDVEAVGNHFLFSQYYRRGSSKKGKPHPEIFLTAAKKLGISPKDCLAFEDTASGIQAAQAAGMDVVGVATQFSVEKLLDLGCLAGIHDYTEIQFFYPLQCKKSIYFYLILSPCLTYFMESWIVYRFMDRCTTVANTIELSQEDLVLTKGQRIYGSGVFFSLFQGITSYELH